MNKIGGTSQESSSKLDFLHSVCTIFAQRSTKHTINYKNHTTMIVHAANPIYDSIFKYLVEDKRIAKILISALLKKEVLDVEFRRHEYTNNVRNDISMFRIDFGARVREADGSEHLVLIELQKTWIETETLRFRQYLGAQYSDPNNIQKEERLKHGYAIPMVTVYLLGHKVGNIEEPILYVNHKSYDYNGHEITQGLPDPFVESLVHNSIIVQIPRLHGHVNNRLEEVLSVFDQNRTNEFNHHIININEEEYANDDDMLYIVRRLTAAAANAKLRHDMNVEDEFFAAIENRDTTIMNNEREIAEQRAYINEQKCQINEQQNQLNEQQNQLNEQQSQLNEQQSQINEKNKMLQSAIKAMMNNGLDVATIATSLGITAGEVEALMAK